MIQIISLIFLSVPIFYSGAYRLLINFVDIGWAYVIDQFLPLAVTSVIAFVVIKRNVSAGVIKRYVSVNWLPILIIIITSLVVHGLMLGNYFLGEGWGVLQGINEPSLVNPSDPGLSTNVLLHPIEGYFRGWYLGIMILSYKLFWNKAELYNFVNLILYILTANILYIFLNQLFRKMIIPSLVGTLFFITTPSYMDMFPRINDPAGLPITLATGILSLIFLFAYQKNSRFTYYVLSVMFYLSAIKIGFGRLHPFIILPLYMCLFPTISSRFVRLNIKRSVLLGIPFVGIFLSYLLVVFILPEHVFEKGHVTLPTGLHGQSELYTKNYLVALSALVTYLFVPSQFAEAYYPSIKKFLGQFPFVSGEISLTFIFGIFALGGLALLGLVALKNIRKRWGRLTVLALIAMFAHLVLTPFFADRYAYLDLRELDREFSFTSSNFGPGTRYVFIPAMGLSMLVALATYWVITKFKKRMYIFLIFMAALFVYYAYLDITNHIYYNTKESGPGRIIPEKVLSMVPHDGQKKLLYSTNPAKNSIDGRHGGAKWLYIFYKINELEYINSFEDASQKTASGIYEKNNFYAFYNNPHTQSFKDISLFAKSELYENRIDQKTVKLTQNANLTTSFTTTNDPSFPLILNRGVLVLEDLSQRVLSSRNLSISLHKKLLPGDYPYVDAFITKEDGSNPFPLGILDTLKNKPEPVNIKQLSLALSVKSLNNQLINILPPRSRIEIARKLIERETSKEKDEIVTSDLEKAIKHYIDSHAILNTFLDSPSFNSLALIYACAEDDDWEKQKKSQEMIGGMWYTKEFPLKKNRASEELTLDLTCFGSVLRKIVIIGPPYPSQLTIENIVLQ